MIVVLTVVVWLSTLIWAYRAAYSEGKNEGIDLSKRKTYEDDFKEGYDKGFDDGAACTVEYIEGLIKKGKEKKKPENTLAYKLGRVYFKVFLKEKPAAGVLTEIEK